MECCESVFFVLDLVLPNLKRYRVVIKFKVKQINGELLTLSYPAGKNRFTVTCFVRMFPS